MIHGDFTNDNVIASGTPPTATGVIDFALAHFEHPLADIGYALWRSGRPAEHATCLDPDRVRQYVHGYHGVRPLSPDPAAAIPAYMFGRGLQMIAKRARARFDPAWSPADANRPMPPRHELGTREGMTAASGTARTG